MPFLEEAFEYMGDDSLTTFLMPVRLLNDLSIALPQLVLAFTGLRAGVDPDAACLDASEDRGGTATCRLTPEILSPSLRFSSRIRDLVSPSPLALPLVAL